MSNIRSHVAWNLEELLHEDPGREPHIRRILRIPSSLPLIPDRWNIFFQIVRFCLPDETNLWRTRIKLERIGTFEGRGYIFSKFLERSLSGRHSYCERLDFALLHFRQVKNMGAYDEIRHLDVAVLQSCLRIGLSDPTEMTKALPISATRLPGKLLRIFVDQGVVRDVADLAWTIEEPRDSLGHSRVEEVELSQAKETIRHLLANGVPRHQLVGLFKHSYLQLDSEQLRKNLDLLKAAQVTDISSVLEKIDNCLWLTPPACWKFLFDVIGARTADEIGTFRQLLAERRLISEETVRALTQLGASIAGLATCQAMLLSLKSTDGVLAPLNELQLLAGVPHALSIEQLAQCSIYLKSGRDLAAFLSVLTQYGYGDADGVLAFQGCYTAMNAETLAGWLSLLTQCARGTTSHLAAHWIKLAGQGGYLDSFDYLRSAVQLSGLEALQQAMKLVPMGVPLLRYLVEYRKLRTLKSLRDWYYHDAMGIEGYRSWNAFDALDTQLLDDAYERRSFNILEGNQSCISHAIDQRVSAYLGPWPYRADKATQADYRARKDAAIQRERDDLAMRLPVLLRRTGGVALPTLLDAMWESPESLAAALLRLSPLLSDLQMGLGPTQAGLTNLEMEAIALVYRTSTDTVQSLWLQVTGRERHLERYSLRPSYPMAWRSMQWRLRKPLDRDSLLALERAAIYADRFSPGNFRDMFLACKHMSPKPLNDDAADLRSLAQHLGVLLAATRGDSIVDQWRHSEFEALTQIDQESLTGHQRMTALLALFEVALPDALDDRLERFAQRFNEADASLLAARLGAPVAPGQDETGNAWLRRALGRTRDKVLLVGKKWARRELLKFEEANHPSQQAASLSALVSTHPAAFFAKEAAQICTRRNTAMWHEERQAHLLVFDAKVQRIAGMALLYIEVLPALHPTLPSLVIRAINPMQDMATSFSATSIVDAFFDVAIGIAKDNGFACVAFPSPGGMHLLSNHPSIEDDIKARFIKRSKPYWRQEPVAHAPKSGPSWRDAPQQVETAFDAYERGAEQVGSLYVIWAPPPKNDVADVMEEPMTSDTNQRKAPGKRRGLPTASTQA